MAFDALFTPGRIGGLELKNRLIMSPMTTLFCDESGHVNDGMINWYVRRAKGGVGLVNVEIAQVATSVDQLRILPRVLRADDDGYFSGLEALAKSVHAAGAKIGLQLTPGGGAQSKSEPWGQRSGRITAVSPSGIAALGASVQPRALTENEIKRAVDSCGDAGRRIKSAGFDLIAIHAHGGYLIAQFLSPYFNRRNDAYGGNLENRCRFLLEIIGAVRAAVGFDFPITVKYSINEFIAGGRGVEESQVIAQKLEAAGVNGIDISAGVFGARIPASPLYFMPAGILVPLAGAIKRVVKIPVTAIGRLHNPKLANEVLRTGKADFIALGRALIADPDWPIKALEGQAKEIRPCLACNECRQQLFRSLPLRCAVNAVAGREKDFDSIKAADERKKILIIGGGPAGLEAARITALKGHHVVLCEKKRRLGGLMVLAGVLNPQIELFLDWLVRQIKNLSVEVRKGTEVTSALVEAIKPDLILVATGGRFPVLSIPGINKEHVFSGQDFVHLLEGSSVHKGIFFWLASKILKHVPGTSVMRHFLRFNFPLKREVAIVGGQFLGCSLALALARRGKKVTILEKGEEFGQDMENYAMVALQYEMKKGNVQVLTRVTVEGISDDAVYVLDERGKTNSVKAGNVFLALPLEPSDRTLARALGQKVMKTFTLGDAESFTRIMGAVSSAFTTAHQV